MHKPKRGRPATGRDPLLSIRVPADLLSRLQKMHKSLLRENERVTVSDIVREAIHLGLDHIAGEKPSRGEYLPAGLRPEHDAEVHEAGHAVIMLLLGGVEDGVDANHWLKKVTLKTRGGGAAYHGAILQEFANNEHRLWIGVAGAVADSIHEGSSFWDVWTSHRCSGDRRNAARDGFKHRADIEKAAGLVKNEFEKSDVWQGLLCVARGLTHGSRTGSQCWVDFAYGRENWKEILADRSPKASTTAL